LLSRQEHEDLVWFLAAQPDSGDEIPGTGGVRKVRVSARGRGKSGGVRVLYYYYDLEGPLYALFLYAKNEQDNPTPEQFKLMIQIAAESKKIAKSRRSN